MDLSNDDEQSGGDAEGDELDWIENLFGTEFADNLTGNDDDNLLLSFEGNDTVDGGAGADTIWAGNGADTVFGGNGGDSDIFDLGRMASSPYTRFDRDNATDTVIAAASFAENGTVTVFRYSDGQDGTTGTIAIDLIDLSDAFDFDFSVDADTPAEQLSNAFSVVEVGRSAQIRDADGNTWFILHEESNGTDWYARPEFVFVTVGDYTLEWDIANGATEWELV